jgi:prepilin-type N-terminal cleavage/methylation domain-containing protein/prepilin-type processing-associated H-X9-DG protein
MASPAENATGQRQPPVIFMKKHSAHSAFTLIELLVVIAIICILMAFLMPTFRTVMENSRTAKCANNLKQIGAAMFLYSQDHDNYFPVSSGDSMTWGTANSNTTQLSWMEQLGPYVGNPSNPALGGPPTIFTCPSSSYNITFPFDKYFSYFNGAHAAYYYASANSTGSTGEKQAIRRTLIAHASEQILSGDITSWTSGGATNPDKVDFTVDPIQTLSTFHNGGINLLFADGHVESVKWNNNLSPAGYFDNTRMTTHYDGTGPANSPGTYYQYLTP